MNYSQNNLVFPDWIQNKTRWHMNFEPWFENFDVNQNRGECI